MCYYANALSGHLSTAAHTAASKARPRRDSALQGCKRPHGAKTARNSARYSHSTATRHRSRA